MFGQTVSWQVINLVIPQSFLDILFGDFEALASALKVNLGCLVCGFEAVLKTSVHATRSSHIGSFLVLQVGLDRLVHGCVALGWLRC